MTAAISFAKSDNDGSVTLDEAKKVAFNHIIWDMKTKEGESFKPGKFGKVTTLYDLNDNPSAYLFELTDKNGSPNGYIVIGADKDYVPIIEYSYVGVPAIITASERAKADAKNNNISVKGEKLYYLQGLQYLFEIESNNDGKHTYDLTYGIKKINKDDYSSIKKVKDENYRRQWDLLLSGNGSTPPTTADEYPLTDPDSYESGYTSKTTKNITSYYRTYYTTTDFEEIDGTTYTNHCGPTTGTNLMLYWYNRDTTKYSSLRPTGGWTDTFIELYDAMETGINGTTYLPDYAYSTWRYFEDRNLDCSYVYSYLNTFNSFKGDLDANRPVTLLVQGHVYYGDHFILGLGYIIYSYSGSNSYYFRVADAWDGTPNRYINYYVGVDYVYRSSLNPS